MVCVTCAQGWGWYGVYGNTPAIAAPKVLGLRRKGLAFVGGEHDASKADPTTVIAARLPHDLTIGEHIDLGCLGMVVHIEGQLLLWSAVFRKRHH